MRHLLASLRSRIFLSSALLAVLAISAAIYLVDDRLTRELEDQLQREIVSTGGLVEQLRDSRAESFTMLARFVADAPKLKAAVDTNDPPTVQNTLGAYQADVHSRALLVTNMRAGVLASVGAAPGLTEAVPMLPSVRAAIDGQEGVALLAQPDGVLQLITVPISVGVAQPDILGTLSVGIAFDDGLASQLKGITGSDIAFVMDGAVLATTLSRDDRGALLNVPTAPGRPRNLRLASGDYVALALPLTRDPAGRLSTAAALVLRSRSEQQRLLRTIRAELAVTAVVAVLLATLLSFAVARTITGPLGVITSRMREVADTGDLTRKIMLRGSRWNDVDAQLLASTFNMLTDSIARFQREVSQKERLSSLGRLSTVIAHEIRNPLMIIKTALHALRQPALTPDRMREALADIDEEIVRLNRIVTDVLDFARPISFDLAPADLNAVCRESATAASATPGPPVTLELDPAAPEVVTDAERLRLALVNLIANARQSFGSGSAVSANAPADARVRLSTASDGDRAVIVIADNGPGIGHDDLPRVFDPYFTTKRGGTGLGLPIAKHVVEGMGGSLTIATVPGRGTDVRIDLPRAPVRSETR